MASISASAEDRIDTIPPPPEESYDSREDCMKSIQAWALERGFAIVVKSLYNGKGKEGNGDHLHWTHFVCDKSGHYGPIVRLHIQLQVAQLKYLLKPRRRRLYQRHLRKLRLPRPKLRRMLREPVPPRPKSRRMQTSRARPGALFI
ncbi:hypothetical protein H4Q26_004718 [Puccinia striiformis f. sp. tritici PST-130]|nr:hypothetical protein H4Q26_004718 [Puccinia striiformis f. sp. tritici PST-130]